jgi:hypothetical protein
MEQEIADLLQTNEETLISLQKIAKIGSIVVVVLGFLCLLGRCSGAASNKKRGRNYVLLEA